MADLIRRERETRAHQAERAQQPAVIPTDTERNVGRRELQLGDRVQILNPKRGQEDRGTLVRINRNRLIPSNGRVTVLTPSGAKIVRAPTNVARLNE